MSADSGSASMSSKPRPETPVCHNTDAAIYAWNYEVFCIIADSADRTGWQALDLLYIKI